MPQMGGILQQFENLVAELQYVIIVGMLIGVIAM